ncbi:glycosyltransferase family 4 protein [Cryptosporangium aurantiacum]|uniref:Glycosyltransferase involved in cell wall bisynthesis n=1 Tax=Cryptosporangium aurantiacum TaxID=134849 RepID=A0A1M7RDT2_9ACTN|nr:glycosyltransferase family 4 protein [Cryptosporangium aurantiacum]SHN44198.1 Glycosyltransferase involved in cell wall bisynthesis [Cryptosporangium aurantiacum]
MTDRTVSDGPLTIVLVEFLPSGGMFQFNFMLGEALAGLGHRVTLLTGPEPELSTQVPGFTVRSYFPTWHPGADTGEATWFRKVRRVWRAARLTYSWTKLVRYVRSARPDVVQLGEMRFALDSFFAVRLAKARRPGTVIAEVAHNPTPYDVSGDHDSVEKSDPVTMRALRAAYKSFDLVLTLGPGPRDDLVKAYPEVRRTAVIGHGEYSAFAGDAAETPGAASAPPRVVFFGTWTRYKNIPMLLNAFAKVRAELPSAELVVAGPVMGDMDLDAVTKHAADIPGVQLKPGYVAMEDVPGLFAGARVVALPYEIVNISGVVHMAYTFARPVVATDVGSMRDVVIAGETGLLAEPTPDGFAEALLVLLQSPADAERMGIAGYEFMKRELSWESAAERAVEGYRSARTTDERPE